MDIPGALATAAAVTPQVTITPLPATEHHFLPPTITLGAYGDSPFHRWWNEIPTGISLLKFGTSYQQFQSPTEDNIQAADIAYIGGREYVISDDEVANLTAAGYGNLIWDVSVPYVAPVMGGVANSGPPGPNFATLSPPSVGASAAAIAPTITVGAVVPVATSVLAGSAQASAVAVPPTVHSP